MVVMALSKNSERLIFLLVNGCELKSPKFAYKGLVKVSCAAILQEVHSS